MSTKPPLPVYQECQKLKEYLFEKRVKISSLIKTDNWKSLDIMSVCKTLKTGKARDENGLIYDIFKPSIAGADLFNSLSLLFNKIKDQLVIPEFMQLMTINSFGKSKGGSKSDMNNQRGVFLLSKVRSIMDKVIHKEYYPHIDDNLGESNVGGRKSRNIRDHIFVLRSVINEVKNGEGGDIEIQGIDISKCFDEMNYEETHNDLWDVSPKDDKFPLIAKLDEILNAKVNTPVGLTEEFVLERLVLQGSVFAPLKCSVQVETFSNDCINENNGSYLYLYKNCILIPPLSMVDDVLTVNNVEYRHWK